MTGVARPARSSPPTLRDPAPDGPAPNAPASDGPAPGGPAPRWPSQPSLPAQEIKILHPRGLVWPSGPLWRGGAGPVEAGAGPGGAAEGGRV